VLLHEGEDSSDLFLSSESALENEVIREFNPNQSSGEHFLLCHDLKFLHFLVLEAFLLFLFSQESQNIGRFNSVYIFSLFSFDFIQLPHVDI